MIQAILSVANKSVQTRKQKAQNLYPSVEINPNSFKTKPYFCYQSLLQTSFIMAANLSILLYVCLLASLASL